MKYEAALKQVLPESVFTADDYLGNFTSAAVSRREGIEGEQEGLS